ncbi:hypothetical protein ACHAXS_010830, partial [Conticribra weissflogii]
SFNYTESSFQFFLLCFAFLLLPLLCKTSFTTKRSFHFSNLFLLPLGIFIIQLFFNILAQQHARLLLFCIPHNLHQLPLLRPIENNSSSVSIPGTAATPHSMQMSHDVGCELQLNYSSNSWNVKTSTCKRRNWSRLDDRSSNGILAWNGTALIPARL